MKNILYLFLAVTLFSCSSGDSSDANDDDNFNFDCASYEITKRSTKVTTATTGKERKINAVYVH